MKVDQRCSHLNASRIDVQAVLAIGGMGRGRFWLVEAALQRQSTSLLWSRNQNKRGWYFKDGYPTMLRNKETAKGLFLPLIGIYGPGWGEGWETEVVV